MLTVIDADLSKYFDTIPHAKLMAVVAERICDGAILHLIQLWLKAPVMEEDKDPGFPEHHNYVIIQPFNMMSFFINCHCILSSL